MASELESKYTRLCGEYKKLREKHKTLKEGLLRERDKYAEIQEQMREMDITIRKFDQERESLVFRNDHLSKQVGYLRDELEAERSVAKQRSSGGSAGSSGASHLLKRFKHSTKPQQTPPVPPVEVSGGMGEGATKGYVEGAMEVLAEELQHKIEECTRLHTQLSEISDAESAEVARLRSEIVRLEEEYCVAIESHRGAESQLREELAKAREDRAATDVKMAVQDRDMKQLALKYRELHNEFENFKEAIRHDRSTSVGSSADSQEVENHSNRPRTDVVSCDQEVSAIMETSRCSSEDMQAFLAKLSPNVVCMLEGGATCCTKFRQRLALLQSGAASDCQKTANNLSTCISKMENSISTLISLMESLNTKSQNSELIHIGSVNSISSECRTLASTISDSFIPLLKEHFEAESKRFAGSSTLQNRQRDILDNLQTLLTRIEHFISITFQRNSRNARDYAENVVKSFENINISIRDITRFMNNKVSIEQEFLKSRPEEKTANNALAHSLINLKSTVDAVSSFLSSNASIVMSQFDAPKKFAEQKRVSEVQSHTSSSENLDSSPSHIPLGHPRSANNGALNNYSGSTPTFHGTHLGGVSSGEDGLLSCSMSRISTPSAAPDLSTLERRVSALVERVSQLEKENHDISLKAQITEKRRVNEKSRCGFLEAALQRHGINLDDAVVNESTSNRPTLVDSLGGMEIESEREKLVRQFYMDKLKESTEQLHNTFGRTLSYHDEARTLHYRLALEEGERQRLNQELVNAGKQLSQVQEDLDLTQTNYNIQISQMTDHIAALTEEMMLDKKQAAEPQKPANQSTRRGFLGLKKS